jgi:hypothetical protein
MSLSRLPAVIVNMRSGCSDLALPVRLPPDNIPCVMALRSARRWWDCGRRPIAFARNG